ncbi:Alanine-tRNA ligase [Xylaria longipes]|nr:Alanine-tRNA ligase [Xylaria longipes]
MDSTASLQDLIVVKESGIAKGVRHIAAFIGERAREAQREAQIFAETVEQISKLSFGPEKKKYSEVNVTNMEGWPDHGSPSYWRPFSSLVLFSSRLT